MSRALGIDYGARRIGFALSDVMRMIASPLCVHTRTRPGDDVERTLELCAEHRVGQLVIGLPLKMDGTPGEAVDLVEDFIRRLRLKTELPLTRWDERLSTVSAEQIMTAGGARKGTRRQLVDKIAAQIILQHYLDSTDLPAQPPGNHAPV
jgi:putative holliday junction resolvase